MFFTIRRSWNFLFRHGGYYHLIWYSFKQILRGNYTAKSKKKTNKKGVFEVQITV